MLFQMFPELVLVFLSIATVHTKDAKYAKLVSGGVITIFLGVVLKKLSSAMVDHLPRDLLYRPRDAFACNMTQREQCGHQMGMPSIHSMMAGYYAGKMRKSNPYVAVALLTVPLSRLSKRDFPVINHGEHGCHTWEQIIAGFTVGLMLSTRI